MLQAVEGIYRDGKIELLEKPSFSEGVRVTVTFLPNLEQPPKSEISFLEAARDFIGCLEEAPADLSTNKHIWRDLEQNEAASRVIHSPDQSRAIVKLMFQLCLKHDERKRFS